MGAADVLEALFPLLLRHGSPEYIRSDTGSEFAAEAMQDWLRRVDITPIRIHPGLPWENEYNERFNGTLRREVLNAEWFTTTEQAQIVINRWLKQYNHTRPHQALDMRPPVPEILSEKHQISGTVTGSWTRFTGLRIEPTLETPLKVQLSYPFLPDRSPRIACWGQHYTLRQIDLFSPWLGVKRIHPIDVRVKNIHPRSS